MQVDNNNTVQLKNLLESSDLDGLFFAGAGRKKAVDSLVHFARFGSMLLFLRGVSGSGRSTVLNEFAISVDKETRVLLVTEVAGNVVEFIADEVDRLAVEVGRLIERVETLNLNGEGTDAETNAELDSTGVEESSSQVESPASRLSRYIKRLGARGRRLVVAFDDALDLSDEELATLIMLAEQNDGVFKLIFSGDDSVASRISEFSERQTLLINFIDLPEFSLAEAQDYIRYRLHASGYEDSQPFKQAQIEAALKRSEGNLNQLHNLLSDVPLAPPKQPRKPLMPLPHMIGAGVLLAVIGLLWLFTSDSSSGPRDVEPIVLERVPSEDDRVAGELTEANVVDEQLSVDVQNTIDQVDEEPASTASAVIAAANADKAPLDTTAELSVENEVLGEAASLAEVVSDASMGSDQLSQRDQAEEESVQSAAIQPASAEPQNVPRLEQESLSTAASVHKRLLGWPETGYALQVFGTHNAARAEQLVADYAGRADLVFYETRHNEKPWFVVVTGPYSGSEAARTGIAQLSDGLRSLRPWPRNVASIHRDIRRYHGN